MSDFLNNLEFLYGRLPEYIRGADAGQGLLLKRFLQPFAEVLDGFDLQLDTFFEKINPETAPQEWVEWWLYALFGWGYFPAWFSDEQRRAFYRDVAQLYAKRGTARGIREFLAHFSVKSHVINRPAFWGEEVWGEGGWMIGGPLAVVVQVYPQADAVPSELDYYGDSFYSDAPYYAGAGGNLQQADVEQLLRWQWPLSQSIIVDYVQP